MWSGTDVYIVGGGTSLRGFDLGCLKGKGVVVGVNDSAFHADADVFFTLDGTYARNRVKSLKGFDGELVFALPPNHDARWWFDATFFERRRESELADDPRYINGVNSGFGALNLAYHRNAKRVFLLGFDMHVDNDGNMHYHEEYPWNRTSEQMRRSYPKWAKPFARAAEQTRQKRMDVWNCSPDSRITAYPKCSLEDLC